MAAKTLNGKIYPVSLYLVRDSEGTIRCYKNDPLTAKDRAAEEIDITKEIVAFGGGDASIANPTCVRLNIVSLERALPFSIGLPEKIRTGKMDGHLRDLTGRIVEILMRPNGDEQFPLNGILMNEQGDMLGNATYNHYGECSDGNPEHSLMLFAGPAEEQAHENNGETPQ